MDLDDAYHRSAIEVPVHRDGKRATPLPDTAAAAAAKNTAKRPRLSDYDADVDFNLLGEMERKQTSIDLAIWMGEFTRHYRLPPDTLHRAFSYLDRALSAPTAHDLHLLGAAAIYAAAKYEGRRLNAADVAWYCGFAASKELTDMARDMLATHLLDTNGGMCLR